MLDNRGWALLSDLSRWPEIAWTGTSSGAKAVHRHLLEATDDGSTVVHTEESMTGPMLTLFYPSAKLLAADEDLARGPQGGRRGPSGLTRAPGAGLSPGCA